MEGISGIDRTVITHSLNIFPDVMPKRLEKRTLSAEKSKVVETEVERLRQVRFLRDSHYPEWIANPVVVPKKDGKARVA